MAQSASALEAELSCPVCFGLFREPVSLPCQHSFCQGCLKEAWIHSPERECPVCRRKGSFDRGTPNLTLRNIVEAYRRESGGASRAGACEKHGDDAGLYCEDCGLLFCPNCMESEQHSQHSHLSVGDATLTYKVPRKILPDVLVKCGHDDVVGLLCVQAYLCMASFLNHSRCISFMFSRYGGYCQSL